MSDSLLRRLRLRAGAVVHDYPRYREAVRSGAWRWMHNRDERITTDGRGVRCEWEFTSDIHLANVFPSTGTRLMRMALADWPIVMRNAPEVIRETPVVSFVIGHRGLSRLQHLLMTLKSIAGQQGVPFECVVVEQDRSPLIESHLPPWVRYRFSHCDTDYNRSATLNEGVAEARGEIVILHDGDTLVPARYAAEVLARARDGFEFIDVKRFTFYLHPEETKRIFDTAIVRPAPAIVTQNGKGVSIAAARRAYLDIGGFDEDFVGWGGEDNDFWDRVHVHGNAYEFGYLPMIHLYHEAQKGKVNSSAAGMRRYHDDVRSIPPDERIRRLLARRSRAPR
ncbi:MAG TPA: galactosyltransferase-related protein [Thermoanaerobaculia bacterium]|nr:galactosyltransferase-related protein [Thermoanaerobaculia bacterium]